MKAKVDLVDLSEEQIEQALAQAKALLPAAIFEVIENVVRAYLTLVKVLEDKDTTIGRLRRVLFGPTSEKSQKVLAPQGQPDKKTKEEANGSGGKTQTKAPPPPPPGHGRNGQAAYRAAKTEHVPHHRLKSGDRCPGCRKGKVYDQRGKPGILVRVTGQAPLTATIYQLQKLRCNLCGEIFEARPPPGVGRRKYDETAAGMIGLLKYGGGFPWNRLHKLERAVGIPLPPSTQWEIVREAARKLEPAYEELKRQAAQGEVLHNDDTAMRILAWMGKRREEHLRGQSKGAGGDDDDGEDLKPDLPARQTGRTGIFTSGIVSTLKGRQMALFFTGLKHAGENLRALLAKRDRGLGPPIQMCDALSRNLPKDLKTIVANCLAHGRRQFVDVVENFPPECEHVLRVLAEVYKNDAIAKKRRMTDSERLSFHQEKSGPLMERLRAWMQDELDHRKVEPNSGLGQAIGYMLKHWEKLTLFLRKPGAPLDNNVCERALKKAILHRKNSLFYKTDNGARVGDVYMSLIHTCELNGVDPFDYLTQLQRYAKEVRARPEKWTPWNYRLAVPRSPPR